MDLLLALAAVFATVEQLVFCLLLQTIPTTPVMKFKENITFIYIKNKSFTLVIFVSYRASKYPAALANLCVDLDSRTFYSV